MQLQQADEAAKSAEVLIREEVTNEMGELLQTMDANYNVCSFPFNHKQPMEKMFEAPLLYYCIAWRQCVFINLSQMNTSHRLFKHVMKHLTCCQHILEFKKFARGQEEEDSPSLLSGAE